MEVLYVRYRILISDDEVDIVEMLTGFFRSKRAMRSFLLIME